jgi:hypothetical protein
MQAQHAEDGDPFADHAQVEDEDEQTFVGEATLNAGRNANLTLGTDSLIVLGLSSTSEYGERRADVLKMKAFENNQA